MSLKGKERIWTIDLRKQKKTKKLSKLSKVYILLTLQNRMLSVFIFTYHIVIQIQGILMETALNKHFRLFARKVFCLTPPSSSTASIIPDTKNKLIHRI